MTLWGPGRLGWRLFDFSLLIAAGISYISILRSEGIAAGTLAATLLMAVHGQDGVMMPGERDLVCAILQLASVALLLACVKRLEEHQLIRRAAFIFALSGFFAAWSVCIKPPAVIFLGVTVAWTALSVPKSTRRRLLFTLVPPGS
jgi:hypothetical protein